MKTQTQKSQGRKLRFSRALPFNNRNFSIAEVLSDPKYQPIVKLSRLPPIVKKLTVDLVRMSPKLVESYLNCQNSRKVPQAVTELSVVTTIRSTKSRISTGKNIHTNFNFIYLTLIPLKTKRSQTNFNSSSA